MEIKKARVSKLMKKDGVDSYGKTSFTVEFDNGDKGYYSTKDANQQFFIAGNVADYTIEQKTSKAGSIYYVINHPEEKAAGHVFNRGASRYTPPDPKVQFISFAASYAKDFIVSGKATPESFEFQFDKIYNKMISKL